MTIVDEDRLTRLRTEESLPEALGIEIMRSGRYKRSFSLVLFRIHVNEDAHAEVFYPLLKVVAFRVQKNIRLVDSAFRVANEILVLLPETSKSGAEVAAQKLRDVIEQYNFNVSPVFPDLKIKFHFGISTFPDDSRNEHELLTIARKNLDAGEPAESLAESPTETIAQDEKTQADEASAS